MCYYIINKSITDITLDLANSINNDIHSDIKHNFNNLNKSIEVYIN